MVSVEEHRALAAALEHEDLRPPASKGICPFASIMQTSCGPHLVLVAHDDVGLRHDPRDGLLVFRRARPEGRPEIEVEDELVSMPLDRVEVGLLAVLTRQPGSRDDEDWCIGNHIEVEILYRELPVGAGWRPVEEQREPIRRPDFAKDDRRVQRVVGAKPADIDPFTAKKIADERAVTVIAYLADDGGAHPKASQSGADIAGEAAHVADEAALLAERRPRLRRIDIRTQAAHHNDFRSIRVAGFPACHVFFQSINHSWSGSVVNSHSRTAPAMAFR